MFEILILLFLRLLPWPMFAYDKISAHTAVSSFLDNAAFDSVNEVVVTFKQFALRTLWEHVSL